MILKFESNRDVHVAEHSTQFKKLPCIRNFIEREQTDVNDEGMQKDSDLLYLFLEKFLYKNFWSWLTREKGTNVNDYIKERPNDVNYPYSLVMLDKVYDITGYLCGHRVLSLLKHNRLKTDYKVVFQEFWESSRYPTANMAIDACLPAKFLLFRQHSEGLYFARDGNYQFIKIIQAIYMQSLSTDVLILFNSLEPVKIVEQVILKSSVVHRAFQQSCSMHADLFFPGLNLSTDKSPIAFLFRFLVQGFIRVYSKDIYQFRLSNVLLSKSGASGIRTTLLTLTAESEKKKRSQVIPKNLKTNETKENDSPVVGSIGFLECPCGKKYKQDKKGWYLRHMTYCNKYAQINSIEIAEIINCDDEMISLNNLIDLECAEEMEDFDWNADRDELLNREKQLEKSERLSDTNFADEILLDEMQDESN